MKKIFIGFCLLFLSGSLFAQGFNGIRDSKCRKDLASEHGIVMSSFTKSYELDKIFISSSNENRNFINIINSSDSIHYDQFVSTTTDLYGRDLTTQKLIGSTMPWSNNGTNTFLNRTGNVGIGTTNPQCTLDVSLGTGTFNIIIVSSIQGRSPIIVANDLCLLNATRLGIGTTNPAVAFEIKTGSLCITNGFMGIGTTNITKASLEINSTQFTNNGQYTAYGYGGYGNYNDPGWYSIWSSGYMGCNVFNAFSDGRIKNIIGISNSKQDFEKLSRIEIVDFKYIDKLNNGNRIHKKVIAQQIEKIMPEVITKTRDFIPNVYEKANNFEKYLIDCLKITTYKQNGFIKDDIVKLEFDGKMGEYLVRSIIDEHTFIISEVEIMPKEIFIYGKQVNDFRTVDYDALTTLNISVTQELIKQIQELKKEIKELRSKK